MNETSKSLHLWVAKWPWTHGYITTDLLSKNSIKNAAESCYKSWFWSERQYSWRSILDHQGFLMVYFFFSDIFPLQCVCWKLFNLWLFISRLLHLIFLAIRIELNHVNWKRASREAWRRNLNLNSLKRIETILILQNQQNHLTLETTDHFFLRLRITL